MIWAKEGKLKRYQDRDKQCKQNKTLENKEIKSYQQVDEECTRKNELPDAKETKQFWSVIWKKKRQNRKAE